MRTRRPDGKLYAVAGATRSGKTVRTAQEVRGVRRLMVWDLKGEWSVKYRCRRVASLVELRAIVKSGAKPERIAYHRPSMVGDFDAFCRLAWIWIQRDVGTLIIEETASVTHPGKAPAAWGDICRMALGYGATVYALTQRPAESDKTAFSNASVIRCGRMGWPDDQSTMARYVGVPIAEVEALLPLQYIDRDATTGAISRGRVNPKLRA